ncbi:MAG: hypothetical protein ABJM86_10715 [Hyphomicrobiales bacterium]
MEYLTFLKIMHLVGLMAGFGGALYTDYLMITRGILRPLEKNTITEIKRLSHFVTFGLIMLWASGAALTLEIVNTNPQFLTNEKFWAKMVIVSALTINGFFIHFYVLKEAKKSLNKRLLIDSSLPVVIVLATCGSLSFTSWVTPFILGKAPEFSYVVPFELIITLWIIAALISIAGVLTLVALQNIWTVYKRSRQSITPEIMGLAI